MWYHPLVIDSLCVSSPCGRAGHPLTWERRVSHCTVLRIRTLLQQGKDHAGVSWVCLYRQREKSAHLRRHPLAILFSIRGRHSPARKAGMTGVHLRMGQAGNAGIQSFPLFYFAQTPRGFVDKSKKRKEIRHEVSRSMEARRPPAQRDGLHETEAQTAPGPQAQGDHTRRGGGEPWRNRRESCLDSVYSS